MFHSTTVRPVSGAQLLSVASTTRVECLKVANLETMARGSSHESA
jgi:hypothetical protein